MMDFNENYPNSYNSLASKLAKEGKLEQAELEIGTELVRNMIQSIVKYFSLMILSTCTKSLLF